MQELVLYNAKAHDYRVSLVETDSDLIRMHIWDEQLGRQVASFQLENPDYRNLPERLLLIASNPLNPQQFSGVQGWLKLNAQAIVVSPTIRQFSDPASSRIDRRRITARSAYTNRHSADDFDEVIQVGAGRAFTTIRGALQSLYDGGPLANQDAPSQLPVCLRANPFHRIALLFDPADQPYTGVSEHVPDWVYLGGRERQGVVFEHAPGATRSIIEGHANTGAFDLTIRNTAPNGPDGSARYGWHTDYVHLVQTPDSEGDVNRDYAVDFRRVRFVVGRNAGIQTFGSGLGVQAAVTFADCEFDCDQRGYAGPIVSANNSSGTIGGGRLIFRNGRDLSGRGSAGFTIAVQTKTDADHPNVVTVDDCQGFQRIALSPGTLGSFPGKWLLRGNTPMTVVSTIPGDRMLG
ncbi:MAG: hypothetical protein V4618_13615 [Pseudomonadota bacterium]